MRLREVGDGAVLLECGNALARSLEAWLRSARPAGFLDAVPGAQTLLVLFDPEVFDPAVLDERPPEIAVTPRTVTLQTVYDGPDLAALSQRLGFDAARAHVEAEHVVQFLGFAPGFAYMSGGFPVPRLSTPRVRVPRGSVAVADGYTGVYPAETPGGWWLIGRIAEELFDPYADPPSLLAPGDRVIFEPAAAAQCSSEQRSPPGRDREQRSLSAVQSEQRSRSSAPVLRVGKFAGNATVHGAPRYGYARYGVPAGGAMDLASRAAANALLGNPPLAAGLECVLATPPLEALARIRVATTERVFDLNPGEILPPQRGPLRPYLAVEGGLAEAPPGAPNPPLREGDMLFAADQPEAATLSRRLPPMPRLTSPLRLRVVRGPQYDWFNNPEALFENEYRLSPQTDRRGARLDGPPLTSNRPADVPPEGTAPGAIQVPGDGKPIILGPDRPVTGGYAKIGAVVWDDLPLLAQARPGTRIQLVEAPGVCSR
ncbi:MAG TPA: carboxyltransferase domain-containing protein [Myxococcales bacterium]